MQKIRQIYDLCEDVFAGVFFLAGVLLINYNVFTRYVFRKALVWGDEVSTYLLIWGGLLGWSIAQRHRRHIRVGLLYEFLTLPVQRYIDIFATLVSLGFCIFVSMAGCKLVAMYVDSGLSSINSGLPYWPIYLIMPISGVMLGFRYLDELYQLIKSGGKEWIAERHREKAEEVAGHGHSSSV